MDAASTDLSVRVFMWLMKLHMHVVVRLLRVRMHTCTTRTHRSVAAQSVTTKLYERLYSMGGRG